MDYTKFFKMRYNCLFLLLLLTHSGASGADKNKTQMVKLLQRMKENGVFGDIDESVYTVMLKNAENGADVFAVNMVELEKIKNVYQTALATLQKTQKNADNSWKQVDKALQDCQASVGNITKERGEWAKNNAKFVKSLTSAQKMIIEGREKLQTCEKQLHDFKVNMDDKSISKLKKKHKKEINILEAKVTHLQQEEHRLNELLKGKDKKTTDQDEVKKLKHALQQNSHDHEKVIAKLKQDHIYETEKIKKELGKLRQGVHNHEKIIANLKQDHKFDTKRLRADFDIVLNTTKDMEEDYKRKVAELKSSMSHHKIEALKVVAAELTFEKNKINEEKIELADKYNKMKDKYDNVLQKKHDKADECKSEKEKILQKLQGEEKLVANLKEDLKSETHKYQSEINKLEQKVQQALHDGNQRYKTLKEIKELKKDNEELTSHLKTLAEHDKVRQREYSKSLNEMKEKYTNETKSLQEKIKNSEKQLKDYSDCKDSIKKAYNARDQCKMRERGLESRYKETMKKFESTEGKLEYYIQELDICSKGLTEETVKATDAINAKKVGEIMMSKKEDTLKEQLLMESNRNKESNSKLRVCTKKLTHTSHCPTELIRIKDELQNIEKVKDTLTKQIANNNDEFKKKNLKLMEENKKLNTDLTEAKVSLTNVKNKQEAKSESSKCNSLKNSLSECEEKFKKCGKSVDSINAKLDGCQTSVKRLSSNHEELISSCKEDKEYIKTEVKACTETLTNSQETLKIVREKFDVCHVSFTKVVSEHEKLESICKDNKEKLKVCVKERGELFTAKQGFDSYLEEKDKEFTTTVQSLHKRNKLAIENETYFRRNYLITVIVCVLMVLYLLYGMIFPKKSEDKVSAKIDSTKNSKQNKRESKKRK